MHANITTVCMSQPPAPCHLASSLRASVSRGAAGGAARYEQAKAQGTREQRRRRGCVAAVASPEAARSFRETVLEPAAVDSLKRRASLEDAAARASPSTYREKQGRLKAEIEQPN